MCWNPIIWSSAITLTSIDSPESFESRLERIRDGDDESFNEMLARWRPYLRNHARSLLKSHLARRADSSDVVQEALVGIHQYMKRFKGQTRHEWAAWVKQIMLNEAKRTRRHHLAVKRSVCSEDHRPDAAQDAGAIQDLGAENRAIDELIVSERRALVLQSLERLEQPMKEVIIRRVFAQQSFREIAIRVKRSEGVARMLWSRGIRRLRQLVDSEGTGTAPESHGKLPLG